MDTVQTILLALLQGLTEFLPISSSAHLILLPRLLGWEDQGLAFDVAVHVGTLLAVIVYFRDEGHRLLLAWFASIVNRQMSADARLAWLVVLGTVPAGQQKQFTLFGKVGLSGHHFQLLMQVKVLFVNFIRSDCERLMLI